MSETLGQRLVAALRTSAQAYAAGDQVAPCAVLWPDPDRQWERILPQLQKLTPELFALGNYAPEQRTGPALWLRCLEARTLAEAPAAGTTPIFYLPGVSRDQLRAVEECPPELAALVELQFRGALWLHVNGKEWTPYAFLVSKHGGLGLGVARDQATLDALAGALTELEELVDRPPDEVFPRLAELEKHHGVRRGYPWQKLGLSPLATALEPLAELAKLCQGSPGAPTAELFAAAYAREGWRTNVAAIATMAACGTQEQHAAVLALVRAL